MGPAHISDVKALSDFRPALIRFKEDAERALMSTGTDAAKVLSWLQRERLPHWKREIRIRSEEAVRANTKLIQQTSSETPRPSVDARKAYEHAKQLVREAEAKHDLTRQWIRKLEAEIDRYRAGVQPMASIARSDMTSAVSRIDAYLTALEAYTTTTTSEQMRNQLKDPKADEPRQGDEQ